MVNRRRVKIMMCNSHARLAARVRDLEESSTIRDERRTGIESYADNYAIVP